MGDVITGDGLTVRVPSACPFCGADERPPRSDFPPTVIGVYECGTAKNFRPDGQCDQSRACLEAAPAFAVAAARAQIVGWLRFQEREWRDTSANLGSSVAGDVAAHYAQALHNAIESIESDAPERWAAEREGSR